MTGIKKSVTSVAESIKAIKQESDCPKDPRPLFNVTSRISGNVIGTIHADSASEATLAGIQLWGVPCYAW